MDAKPRKERCQRLPPTKQKIRTLILRKISRFFTRNPNKTGI